MSSSIQIPKIEDPKFEQQWNLKLMNVQPETAWSYTMGEGTVIGLIDSGIDFTHVDLGSSKDVYITADYSDAGKKARYDAILQDVRDGKHDKVLPGWNFLNDTDDIYDYYRHGTSVAGVMLADADNVGIVGVAPQAKVRPYVVADTRGYATQDNLMKAINRAVDDGCDVINMSLAWMRDYKVGVTEAAQNAIDKGVLVVAAAGNNDSALVYFPACIEGVIAVGGCNAVGQRWVHSVGRGSNYGAGLVCLAPSDAQTTTLYMRSRYETIDGTSLAAGNASGVMALLKSIDKKITAHDVLSAMSKWQTWDNQKGYGVLDAYRLIKEFYGKQDPVKILFEKAYSLMGDLEETLNAIAIAVG